MLHQPCPAVLVLTEGYMSAQRLKHIQTSYILLTACVREGPGTQAADMQDIGHAQPPGHLQLLCCICRRDACQSLFSAQAHASGSGDADLSQPCPESSLPRAPDPQITDKDAAKARDATIVAIGIVAVLIVNVAYVGAPPCSLSLCSALSHIY